MDIDTIFRKAVEAHGAGRFDEADALYIRILEAEPAHSGALHYRGILALQRGEPRDAIDLIQKAIHISPDNTAFYNNLGAAYRAAGEPDQAEECYRSALKRHPENADAWYNLGNILLEKKAYTQSIDAYDKTLKIRKEHPEAWTNQAAAYNAVNQPDHAIACCRKAISIAPQYPPAYHNLGVACRNKGEMRQAVKAFTTALELGPGSAETHSLLADTLAEQGKTEASLAHYYRAITADPQWVPAHGGMGALFRRLGRYAEAKRCFQICIDLAPGDYRGYQNLGNIHLDMDQPGQAHSCYGRALGLQPDQTDLLINQGLALRELGQADAELEYYRKALDMDPENEKACSHLVDCHMQNCDWTALAPLDEKLDRMTRSALARGQRPEEMPFLSISRNHDASHHHEIARAWSRKIEAASGQARRHAGASRGEGRQNGNKPITIGYLSNNFRNHPTAHLTSGLFRLHDREGFRIFAYSYGEDDGSDYRKEIVRRSDRFVDLKQMDHHQAARRIREDGVDILVDLVGYMRGGRLEIPALRPAPLQVRWLGLAGTTGAGFFDYLITHPTVTPENDASYYSESFAYMPDCYQVNDYLQNTGAPPMSRAAAGLPEKGVVFCSFSTHYKIDSSVFHVWMRLLQKVPGSVLWLLAGKGPLVSNLRKAAKERGVDPDRLTFAEKAPKDQHLNRLRLADISLDTWRVNGAATTSDALWAGVPVVTLKGNHFASRMSANLLEALGMPDLIAEDRASYEDMALRLAARADERNFVRKRIKANKECEALFDTHRFVGNLEMVYRKMWMRYLKCKAPTLLR